MPAPRRQGHRLQDASTVDDIQPMVPLTSTDGTHPQPLHKKSQGYGPSVPQPGCGRITSMSFDEAKVRLEAARDHLQHAIDGDIDPVDGIHYARRLLLEAERLLRRDAA